MIKPSHEIAPATGSVPLDGQGGDGVATAPLPGPAQPFPLDAAARALLVRRAMSLHVVAAENHMQTLDDAQLASGEAMEVAIEGLREAAQVLERRQDLRRLVMRGGQ